MKTIFSLLLLLLSGTSFGQEEIRLIETSTMARSTTTTYTDGSSETSSPSYSLSWRYAGESSWRQTGRRYKDIAVPLNRYESSAALLQKTKNLDLYGKGTGWLMMGGGLTMAIIGFTTKKEVGSTETFDGQTIIEYEDRTTLGWAGLAVLGVGYYVRWGSIQISMKRFDQACEEYNKMAGKDISKIGDLDFGLTASNFTPYPMMNFKLRF